MSKLLFAHDDWITIQSDGRPLSFNYTRQLIDRYRYLADHITFAVRCIASATVSWYEDADIVCIPDIKHGWALLHYGDARRRVSALVAEHDLVVARLPSLIGSWALRAAWQQGKPALVEFVGCPWDALWNHSLKGQLVAPFFYIKNRRLARRASHVVYVTERFLQSRYPTQGSSIACSNVEIELAPVQVLARRQERWHHRRLQGPIVLGTVANLNVHYKGHDLVLRALSALGDAKQQYVYHMIGPGNSERLASLAQSLGVQAQVVFVGGVPREAIPAALDEVDIYLQPSRQEGLPRAMIEAMARGCVVIGANTGGIPELLPSESVIPRGNWRRIADRLRSLPDQNIEAVCRRNWETAATFQLHHLNTRRRNFYDLFLSDHGLKPTLRNSVTHDAPT